MAAHSSLVKLVKRFCRLLSLVEFNVTAVLAVKGNNLIAPKLAIVSETSHNPTVGSQNITFFHFSAAFSTLHGATHAHVFSVLPHIKYSVVNSFKA
jgi:hypothetical protein